MATPGKGGDYRAARIGAALALTGVVAIVVVADAVNAAYTVDPLVLGTLLTAIVTLLGREAVNLLRQPSPPPPTWTEAAHVRAAKRNAQLPEIPDSWTASHDPLRDDPSEDSP